MSVLGQGSFWLVYRSLAIGIGIQNFPEGLAVSLPLRAAGVSLWKSFWLVYCPRVCVCVCVRVTYVSVYK